MNDVFDVSPKVAPVLETDADGRLYYRGDRTGFTRLDRSYVTVAAKAFTESQDVALIYPSPPSHVQIPILLAVGFQVRSDPPALFVSNKSGVRERFFNVGIGPKYAPADAIDPEPLGDFTAPMVKTGDGQRLSYITHHKPNHWKPDNPDTAAVVHTSFGKKVATTLSDDLEISGIILDFTTGLLDDPEAREAYEYHADERDIPRIMLFDTPQHPYLGELEQQNEEGDAEVLFWGWSVSELEAGPKELLQPFADVTIGNKLAPEGGHLPSPFVDSINSLRNVRNGIDRSVIEVPYGDLERVAKNTYKRISDVARFPNDTPDEYSSASRGAITNAYFLYMYLDTLLLSVEFHDSLSALDDANTWGTSNTLRGKIEQLRKRTPVLDRDVPGSGPILEEVCDLFDNMVDLLTVHNAKADALIEEIRTVRNEDKEITIFTATRNQESLLRSFVAEMTEFGRGNELTEKIHFQSLYNPHTVPPADVVIFPGVPTRSHYPAIQNGAAPDQRFVMYSWEVERLSARLNEIVGTANTRVGPGVQHYTADKLDLPRKELEEYVGSAEPRQPIGVSRYGKSKIDRDWNLGVDDSKRRKSNVRSLPESKRVGASPTLTGEDLEFELSELTSEIGDEELRAESVYDDGVIRETIDEGRTRSTSIDDLADQDGSVRALKIEFTDESYMFEEPRGLVWSLDTKNGSSVRRVRRAAQNLEAGEQLLLIHDDSRRDVFEHVVEKIHSECRGPFQQYLLMLDLWNSGLDRVVTFFREMEEEMNKDPSTLDVHLTMRTIAEIVAEDLTEYSEANDIPSADREQITVEQWLERRTIGPSSPTPIRAMGEIYEVEVLKSHSNEIFSGLEEVRNLHQRVGRKLEKIIFSTQTADADEWLLEEVGLRVGDVQDATVVKRVAEVDRELHEVPLNAVGKLCED